MGQVQQSGKGDEQHAHDRQHQQLGLGGGKIRGKGGTLLSGQLPYQNASDRRQQHQQGDQSQPGDISGNRQAGLGLEAGAVLQQPQEERRGAAQNGQRGQSEMFFHIKRPFRKQIIVNATNSISRPRVFVYAGAYFPPGRRIEWRDNLCKRGGDL